MSDTNGDQETRSGRPETQINVSMPDGEGVPADELDEPTDAWAKADATQQQGDDNFEYGSGSEEYNLIKPPYNPSRLAMLSERSETHAACLSAKARWVAGFGLELEQHEISRAGEGENTDDGEEPPGKDAVWEFWFGSETDFQLGPSDMAYATANEVLENAWYDYESVGWYAIEILCNPDTGEPNGLAHVPAHTIRMRDDGKGFVQHPNDTDEVHFAAAGMRYGEDKEFVDAQTGRVHETATEPDEIANELIVQRNYSATSTRYGTPDVVPALQTIEGDIAARQYNTSFFENEAVPRFAVIIEGAELPDKIRKELKKSFKSQLKGAEESHRTIVLDVVNEFAADPETGESASDINVRLEPLTVGVEEDASFVEFRRENKKDIRQAHDVPPIIIGDDEDINHNSAKTQRRNFAEETVQRKQELFAARLYKIINATALAETKDEDASNWTLSFQLRGVRDQELEADVAKKRVNGSHGALTINEVREEFDYGPLSDDEGDPVDDGDTLAAALMNPKAPGLRGLGDPDVPPTPTAPGQVSGWDPEDGRVPARSPMIETVWDVPITDLDGIDSIETDKADPRLVSTDSEEDQLADTVTDVLTEARDRMVDRMQAEIGGSRGSYGRSFDPIEDSKAADRQTDRLASRVADAMRMVISEFIPNSGVASKVEPVFEAVIQQALDTISQPNHEPQITTSYGVGDRQAAEFAANSTENEVKDAADGMFKQIRKQTRAGLEQGLGYKRIAENIREEIGDDVIEARADLIARMEAQKATNRAKLRSYESSDVVTGITVINTCGPQTTPLCRHLSGCGPHSRKAAYFDHPDGKTIDEQLEEQVPDRTLIQGFSLQSPPYHYGCRSGIVSLTDDPPWERDV